MGLAASTGNIVQGNYVGTDKMGTKSLANHADGVLIFNIVNTESYATDTLVGGVRPAPQLVLRQRGLWRGGLSRREQYHSG